MLYSEAQRNLRKELDYVPHDLVPKSMTQRNLSALEVLKDFILSLCQFLGKPLASILNGDIPLIILLRENIRESKLDEDINSVLIEVLGQEQNVFISK